MSDRLDKFIQKQTEGVRIEYNNFFSYILSSIEKCEFKSNKYSAKIKLYREENNINSIVLEDIIDFCFKKNLVVSFSKWLSEWDEDGYPRFSGYECTVRQINSSIKCVCSNSLEPKFSCSKCQEKMCTECTSQHRC